MTDIAAFSDIPRLLTAVAEWGACVVYVLILSRRWNRWASALVMLAGFLLLVGVQLWAGTLPIALWVPGMAAAVAVMLGLLSASLTGGLRSAGFLTVRAFVLAELVASLHWQLDRYYLVDASLTARAALFIGVYVPAFALAWLAENRHLRRGSTLVVSGRELVGAVAIGVVTFGISNLSFIDANTPFSGRLGPEISLIRTLVDLSGYIALYVQQGMRREMQARRDADAMSQLLRSQHEQYELSRRAIDEMNRTHHDMKHVLDVLRVETDPRARERILADLEEAVAAYGAQVRTGNRVVDAVLVAKNMRARDEQVEVSFVVDGTLLDFMDPLDITAVLGNAVDNAIEAAARVPDVGRRSVRVAVFAQDDFVMIRVENPFAGTVQRSAGRIVSRKRGAGHGYGLRNIEAAVERYGGSTSISHEDQWFSLRVLLPRVAPAG